MHWPCSFGAGVLLSTLPPVLASSFESNLTAQEATELALTYAYPLLAFKSDYLSLVPRIGVNNLGHARQPNTAASRGVVKPNVDTLYSSAIYDLSRDDLAIQIPTIPDDQYALFSFHDLYGDNFAILGRDNFTSNGTFCLTHRQRPFLSNESDLGENATAPCPLPIWSPTTFGVILVRWLLDNGNLDTIHTLQNATSVTAVPKKSQQYNTIANPSISSINWNDTISTPARNSLNLLCQIGSANTPGSFPIPSNLSVRDITATSGACNHTPASLNIDIQAANQSSLSSIQQAGQSALQPLNNGWSAVQPNLTGTFGRDYGLRAEIARTGYLMLQAPSAVYPSWSNGTTAPGPPMQGQVLHLGADESFIYNFSCKPPLRRLGFWSLTAYDSAGFLVSNARDVYSLGDRSNITYASGQAVYDANSQDGSFQLLIQPADMAPPANWTSNWLPGPSGGGNLTALLRWFEADDALMDGTYEYPVVTKQGAIR